MYKKLQARVYGEVHGVGFRRFVLRNAEELGLSGWVRNCEDETVKIEVIGAVAPLEDFFARLQSGPENAVIAEIEDEWSDYTGEPNGEFEILESK